jgi:hypothetical protein
MAGLFAKTAASFLRKYLSMYVENFDAEKLSLSVLRGHIELEDLVLRADAIEIPGEDFPLEVAAGFIGRLRINIPPWKRLTKRPVEVELQNVCLVLRRKNQDYGVKKMEKLDAAEREIMAAEQANTEPSMFSRFLTSATSSLLQKVVQNIQVTLLDLHVSYEDSPGEGPATAASGCSVTNLSLTRLIVRSVDSTGRPFSKHHSIKQSDTNYKEVVLTSVRVDMLTGEQAEAYLALGRDARNSIVRQMRVQRSDDKPEEDVKPEEINISELDLGDATQKDTSPEKGSEKGSEKDTGSSDHNAIEADGPSAHTDGPSAHMEAESPVPSTGFMKGDRVLIIKEGAKKGLEATVTNPSWTGRVKVDLDGMTKSYQPTEIKLVYRPSGPASKGDAFESSGMQESAGERRMWDGELLLRPLSLRVLVRAHSGGSEGSSEAGHSPHVQPSQSAHHPDMVVPAPMFSVSVVFRSSFDLQFTAKQCVAINTVASFFSRFAVQCRYAYFRKKALSTVEGEEAKAAAAVAAESEAKAAEAEQAAAEQAAEKAAQKPRGARSPSNGRSIWAPRSPTLAPVSPSFMPQPAATPGSSTAPRPARPPPAFNIGKAKSRRSRTQSHLQSLRKLRARAWWHFAIRCVRWELRTYHQEVRPCV